MQDILVAIPVHDISIMIINSDGTKSILKVDPCVLSVLPYFANFYMVLNSAHFCAEGSLRLSPMS